ncbi:MAG: hypothetical protein AAFP19_05640 [Bacteroidota bacterium]
MQAEIYKKIKLFWILLLFSGALYAQPNTTNNSTPTPIDVKGYLRMGLSFYGSGIDSIERRSPLAWTFSGRPVFISGDWKVPLFFSFRNQTNSLSPPLQRFGIAPTYKWLKVTLGHSQPEFSRYILSGQTVWGVGVQINEEESSFRFKALYGRLENLLAQRDTLIYGSEQLEVFDRRALAIKIGAGSRKTHVDFTFFKGRDDADSQSIDSAFQTQLRPADNTAVGLDTKVTFYEKDRDQLFFEGNIAASAFTRNQNSALTDAVDSTDQNVPGWINTVVDPNVSTRVNFAGDASLAYQSDRFRLKLKYQRIDPLYQSMGLYYLTDDYANYTAALRLGLLDKKVWINGTFGIQRNNLYDLRAFTNTRRIGSVYLNVLTGPSFGLNAHYANYQLNQEFSLQEVGQGLALSMVTNSFGFTPRYTFSNKKIQQMLSFTFNAQRFDDLLQNLGEPGKNTIRVAVLNYRRSIRKQRLSINGSLNWNATDFRDTTTSRIGGTIGATQKLLKKTLVLKARTSWNRHRYNDENDGSIFTFRIEAQYKLMKKHKLRFSLFRLRRDTEKIPPLSEWRGRLFVTFML